MTHDSAFISEIWSYIKTAIPKDEKSTVCEGIVSIFDSYNCSEGFEDDVGFEKTLANAIRTFYGHDDDEDDADEEDYDD